MEIHQNILAKEFSEDHFDCYMENKSEEHKNGMEIPIS